MPPFLKKQVFGLPAWAWLSITSVALAAGLYARHKANENKGEDTQDPCDSESEAYDPATCNQGSTSSAPSAGYDSADPCDPTSVTYDPAACQASAGIGYESGGTGGGGFSGGYGTGLPPSEPPETPAEIEGAAQGGVNITAPLLEQNIYEVKATKAAKGKGTCKSKNKPKPKKGYRITCVSGKWHYESKSHAAKKKKNPTHKMTGGGAPNKKNDKMRMT